MEGESSSDNKTSVRGAEAVSLKHYNRLITELRCPGCAYPMKSPILQCFTGHSICETCTRILDMCPLCQKAFCNTRSLTLEALCAKAHFNCSNSCNGCRVRLPIKLLECHEQQCVYKVVKCFMGKVWDNCNFSCREIDWKEHVEEKHKDKLYTTVPVELTWDINERRTALAGYFVLQHLGEMFYLYHIYDKTNSQVLWTMTHIPTPQEKPLKYAFEVELYCPTDGSKIICQRYPCHLEADKDILQDGTCVSVTMCDVMRFINVDKVLHYRVTIQEVKIAPTTKQFSPKRESKKILPKDFQFTTIEGVNHKLVPNDMILTGAPSEDNGIDPDEKLIDADKSSDSDPELEMFVNDLISSTPKLNFNRRFFNEVSSTVDVSESSYGAQADKIALLKYGSVSDFSSQKKVNPLGKIAKSFMNLKVEMPDFKSLGKGRSSRKSLQ